MFFKIKSNFPNIFLALASLLQISFIISSEYVLQVNSATALQEIEENPGNHFDVLFIFVLIYYRSSGVTNAENNLDYYKTPTFLQLDI